MLRAKFQIISGKTSEILEKMLKFEVILEKNFGEILKRLWQILGRF